MRSTVDVTTELRRQFGKHYDTFLFAPKFIQEVLYIDSQLRVEGPDIIPVNLNAVCDKVIEGVERSFLILGDSGSGKTSFALKLCQTLWSKSGVHNRNIIPIYVNLPPLVVKLNQIGGNSESEFDIVKTLVQEYEVNGIERCSGQIVFILDSFDEISSFSQSSKIIQHICTNTTSWSAEVTIVTCSRPEAVPKLKRQEMFEFVKFGDVSHRKYSEFTLEGLSGDRVSGFLEKMEQYVIPQLKGWNDDELARWSAWGILKGKIQDWESGDYNRWFEDLPDLKKLSENPYILTLICQALPGIVLKVKNEEKVDSKLHRISANAITILNKAHVCFSGQNYRDIQIQGADLRQSICAKTDFRGANLTNVQFGDSYLVGTQFQGSCMVVVDFGEFPILKLSTYLNAVVCYKDKDSIEDNWVIATRDGAVRIWNTLEEKSVLPQCQRISHEIDTRLSLLNAKVAVWTESTKYPVSPLSTTMVTYEVSLYDLTPKWKFFKKYTLQTTEGVDQVYIQFRPMDKCVFIYSTCHLEVLSYSPKTESDTENLIIGDGNPNRIFTFASIVDTHGDILIACHENCIDSQDGRTVVYKYNEFSRQFTIIYTLPAKPFSGGAKKLKYGQFYSNVFKADGSGLAVYNGKMTNIQIIEEYYRIIPLIHPSPTVFESFAFDNSGKYLAGFTTPTFNVYIWNVANGTIHSQFCISSLSFPLRFSNPLTFSSDSKVIAFRGSEFHSHTIMRLKSISENPTIHDSSRQKSVYDLAVSGDGEILVIVGIDYRSIVNYIEIFKFPFASSTGLCVDFRGDMTVDITCLVGIMDSKSTEISKKNNCDSEIILSSYCMLFEYREYPTKFQLS